MPIDEAFDTSTNQVLIDMAQRPRPPVKQAPSFSLWSTFGAAPKGVAAGAAEGTGSTADILGAFGQVLGAYPEALGPVQLTDDQRKEADAAREKLLSSGPDYNSEAGRLFRNVGKDYMPDPVTAHGAETAVANLFRLGSKAVVAGTTLGAVPGAIVAGAEEGFTASDELGQRGVDLGTRSAVGAVTAAVTAAGFAIPVAGQTVRGTVGLALAGGPASFVVQNAASREILKRANYAEQANQYDPFDPVGLTLSTLLPLGFGALAMRGMKAKARVDTEAVDAARVAAQREHIDATNPAPVGDLAGAAQHEAALNRAMDQMAAGEKVEVSDVAPPLSADLIPVVTERLQPLIKTFEEEAKVRAAQPDIEAALQGQQSITDKLGERYRVTIHEEDLGAAKDTKGVFVQVFDPITGQRRGRIDFAVNKDGTLAAENTNVAPAYQRRGIAQAMYQSAIDAGYKVVPGRKQTDVGAKMVDSLQSKGLIGGKKAQATKATEPAAAKAPKFKSESHELDRAVKELEDLSPDHPVLLDGMTEPMSVRELMARVRQEATMDAGEAHLVEAAASCFLRTTG